MTRDVLQYVWRRPFLFGVSVLVVTLYMGILGQGLLTAVGGVSGAWLNEHVNPWFPHFAVGVGLGAWLTLAAARRAFGAAA